MQYKKNYKITIALDKEQYDLIQYLAEADSRKASNYCKMIIEKYLKEIKK